MSLESVYRPIGQAPPREGDIRLIGRHTEFPDEGLMHTYIVARTLEDTIKYALKCSPIQLGDDVDLVVQKRCKISGGYEWRDTEVTLK